MKLGFEIDGKMLNVDLILQIADEQHLSPEEMSKRIGMGRMYLRNRKNEMKKGIYRKACKEVILRAMNYLNLPFDDLIIDIPSVSIVRY